VFFSATLESESALTDAVPPTPQVAGPFVPILTEWVASEAAPSITILVEDCRIYGGISRSTNSKRMVVSIRWVARGLCGKTWHIHGNTF